MIETEIEEYYSTTWDHTMIPFKELTQQERRMLWNSSGFAFWKLDKAWQELKETIAALLRR